MSITAIHLYKCSASHGAGGVIHLVKVTVLIGTDT